MRLETGGLTAIAVLLGLGVGSFLNVVVYRVPRKGSLVRPASACPGCGTPIRPRDNVPVVSWVLLKGRCRTCGMRISARYPVVELVTALLFVAAVLRFPDLEEAAFVAAASAVFVALAFVDLEHKRVPNVIVVPATGAALVWVAASSLIRGEARPLVGSLGAGAALFVLLLLIALVSPGGMGMGDVKLAALVGVVTGRFGPGVAAAGIFSAFMVGGVVGLAVLATRRGGRKTAIPFAPMLVTGALIGVYAGDMLVEAWLP